MIFSVFFNLSFPCMEIINPLYRAEINDGILFVQNKMFVFDLCSVGRNGKALYVISFKRDKVLCFNRSYYPLSCHTTPPIIYIQFYVLSHRVIRYLLSNTLFPHIFVRHERCMDMFSADNFALCKIESI